MIMPYHFEKFVILITLYFIFKFWRESIDDETVKEIYSSSCGELLINFVLVTQIKYISFCPNYCLFTGKRQECCILMDNT